MTTRLRQCTARGKNARAFHHVGAGGFCQIPVATTGVAHRGEAAHEHALHDGQSAQSGKYVGLVGRDIEVQMRGNDVDMAIDQARHQGFTLSLDHLGARCNENVWLVGHHRLDQAVFNPNVLSSFELQGRHIEHIGRLKQDRVHGGVACDCKNHIKTENFGLVSLGNYPDFACDMRPPSPRMRRSYNLDRI